MTTLAVPSAGTDAGPSRSRTHSVVSLSSELSEAEEVTLNTTRSRATSSSALSDVDDNESEESEDDEIMEVNADGSAKGATRIRELVSNPPKHPKHRWETAVRASTLLQPGSSADSNLLIRLALASNHFPQYVYAFLERFTTVQEDSAHAPQTILEFEQALMSPSAPVMPENAEDEWKPSLAPVLHDFVDRARRTHKEVGGSGGISGTWQMWVPWSVSPSNVRRQSAYIVNRSPKVDFGTTKSGQSRIPKLFLVQDPAAFEGEG